STVSALRTPPRHRRPDHRHGGRTRRRTSGSADHPRPCGPSQTPDAAPGCPPAPHSVRLALHPPSCDTAVQQPCRSVLAVERTELLGQSQVVELAPMYSSSGANRSPCSSPRSDPQLNTRPGWSNSSDEAASRASSVASRARALSGIHGARDRLAHDLLPCFLVS